MCDLGKTELRSCILRSPLIADTFSWTCMFVKYELSSDDVDLTLDLLVDDESMESHSLLASENLKQIPNPGLGSSSVSIQFTASRYLLSNEDYEHALVSAIEFFPCTDDNGKLLCFQSFQ